jgi:hypothetical protein
VRMWNEQWRCVCRNRTGNRLQRMRIATGKMTDVGESNVEQVVVYTERIAHVWSGTAALTCSHKNRRHYSWRYNWWSSHTGTNRGWYRNKVHLCDQNKNKKLKYRWLDGLGVARICFMINASKCRLKNLKERAHVGELGVDGRIILK